MTIASVPARSLLVNRIDPPRRPSLTWYPLLEFLFEPYNSFWHCRLKLNLGWPRHFLFSFRFVDECQTKKATILAADDYRSYRLNYRTKTAHVDVPFRLTPGRFWWSSSARVADCHWLSDEWLNSIFGHCVSSRFAHNFSSFSVYVPFFLVQKKLLKRKGKQISRMRKKAKSLLQANADLWCHTNNQTNSPDPRFSIRPLCWC